MSEITSAHPTRSANTSLIKRAKWRRSFVSLTLSYTDAAAQQQSERCLYEDRL